MVAQSEDVSDVYKQLFTRQIQRYQQLKCKVDELNNSKKYFSNILSVTRDFNKRDMKDIHDICDIDMKIVEKTADAKTKDYEETLVTASARLKKRYGMPNCHLTRGKFLLSVLPVPLRLTCIYMHGLLSNAV